MTVSDADKSNALLISTRDGTYPESEEILTAGLDGSALESSLQRVNEAKIQIEVGALSCFVGKGFLTKLSQTDIQRLSRKGSSDVDEWISKARRLQEDIDRSKTIAREVVRDYEEVRNLSASVHDAKARLELLQNETSFNHAITLSLEDTSSVDRYLNEAESTLAGGKLIELAANVEQLSSLTHRLIDSSAKDINLDRLLRIQNALVEGLTTALNSMVEFDKTDGQRRVTVNHGRHGQFTTNQVYKIADTYQRYYLFLLSAF
jgi:protein transport protein DSL1/ZW10